MEDGQHKQEVIESTSSNKRGAQKADVENTQTVAQPTQSTLQTTTSRILRSRTSIGLTKAYVTIPPDRVGVVIGKNGETIKKIMEATKTKISVDEVNGVAVIEPASPSTSPYDIMKAQEIIKAISYGFPFEKAFKLLEEDAVLIVIDLTQYVKDSENHLTRVKGRIIGEGGRARKNIEEMTNTYISIYGDYVAIIGSYENANVAREAIMMLIEGRQHSTVYRYIDKLMRQIRRTHVAKLWEKEF